MCEGSCCCVKLQDQKQLGEERVCFYLAVQATVLPEGSPTVQFQFQSITEGRQKKLEAEADAMEESCTLTCSWWLSQPAFLQHQDHQPKGSTAHSKPGPPTSVIIKENAPFAFSFGQSGGAFSQSLFQNDSSLYQANVKTIQ